MAGEEDRLAILNQLGGFARLVDGRRWDDVADIFDEAVTFDYGGPEGEQAGIAALRAEFQRYLDNCGPSQHLLGSIQLDFDATGGGATTRAYVQARHQGRGGRAHLYLDSNGEYVDRWVRRPQGWRIVRRDATWATHRGDFSVLMPADEAGSAG